MFRSENIIGIVGAGISGPSVARELERGATAKLFTTYTYLVALPNDGIRMLINAWKPWPSLALK